MTDIVRDRPDPTDTVPDRDCPPDPFLDFLSYCIDALENDRTHRASDPERPRLRLIVNDN